jgi:hypothetical protein
VDGNDIQQGGAVDFGGEISVNFGSTASCVELRLDLLTDELGYDTELWLVNAAAQEWLWSDYGVGNNESRQYRPLVWTQLVAPHCKSLILLVTESSLLVASLCSLEMSWCIKVVTLDLESSFGLEVAVSPLAGSFNQFFPS